MKLIQPYTGIFSTLLLSISAAYICTAFTPDQFGSWVTLVLVSMVPGQMILTLFLGSSLPAPLHQINQPLKGLLLTLVMIVIGCVTFVVIQTLNEGLFSRPTPFSIMQAILMVVITLWMIIIFQAWPANLIKNPFIGAILLWMSIVLVSWLMFQLFFNFSIFQGAPFYTPDLDPDGLLSAWHALALSTTSVAVILAFVMLDFWPFSTFRTSALINAVIIAGLSWGIWAIAMYGIQADPVRYMVAGPISVVFGEFILLIMLQTAPFQQMIQPKKGLILTLIAVGLSQILFPVYATFVSSQYPDLNNGAPTYGVELWIASAMLAVTFPLFVLHAEMFQFWPFKSAAAETTDINNAETVKEG